MTARRGTGQLEFSFDGMVGNELPDSGVKIVNVDRELVQRRLKTIADDGNQRRYIL